LRGDLQHVAQAGDVSVYGVVEHRADERRAVALGGAQLQTLGFRHQPCDEPLTTTLESQLGRVEQPPSLACPIFAQLDGPL